MSWMTEYRLQKRIGTDAVPLILCGPMLRRVDSTSVSVFVALKYARDITLNIMMGSSVLMQGARRTVQLGEHLHVALVTAKAESSQGSLVGGATYHYDLTFARTDPRHPSDTAPASQNLKALGMLRNPFFLGFDENELPSFALPPGDLNRLRLIHGSCRKPHGESLDALEGVDVMLRSTRGSAVGRPHQLFLGGDQIYADDVADALLLMLMDASETLLGWREIELVRGQDGRFDTGYSVSPKGIAEVSIPAGELMPGHRGNTARARCGFTAHPAGKSLLGIDLDRSHLLFFGEYAAMYLFAWSAALWPSELPEFEDLYPGSPKFTGLGALTPRHAEFLRQRRSLQLFSQTLPQVQRALANVPTYMIFDDHEITDDWFLNLAWCRQVLSKPLGRGAIQNGLSAFAVFQAWGNVPETFKFASPGGSLLVNLSAWSGLHQRIAAGERGLEASADAARAEVNRLIGMPANVLDQVEEDQGLIHPPGTLDWHFRVEGPGYEVIVLDTRTWRGYAADEAAFARLISDVGLRRQISELGVSRAEVTLVVSAVPVMGVPVVEKAQEFFSFTLKKKFANDAEAWALQGHSFEYLLSLLGQRLPRDPQLGRRRGHVVLLSGDVHYGFAGRVQYWATSPYDPVKTFASPGVDKGEMVAVQFTSSALKNEISKTRLLHDAGYIPGVDKRSSATVAAWNNHGGRLKTIGHKPGGRGGAIRWDVVGNPGRADINGLPTALTVDPHWTYRIDFLLAATDVTEPAEGWPRTFRPRLVPPIPAPGADNLERRREVLAIYLTQTDNHGDYTDKHGDGKEIVGHNNVGEISFIWDQHRREVLQHLWWRLKRIDNDDLPHQMFPLTQYVASLRFDDERYPEPSRRVNL